MWGKRQPLPTHSQGRADPPHHVQERERGRQDEANDSCKASIMRDGGYFAGSGGLWGLQVLTHGLPACRRAILGMRLERVVLEQLLGQRHIPISNFSDSPSSDQGLQGPQQSLVLLNNLGQASENTRSWSVLRTTWTVIPTRL